MIWERFEEDKKEIESIYNERKWNPESGLSPEELCKGCNNIEVQYSTLPRMAQKALMYKFVLENAQLDVREADFFPERLRHDYLIAKIRERWINHLRANEMRDVLAAHETEQEGLCYMGNIEKSSIVAITVKDQISRLHFFIINQIIIVVTEFSFCCGCICTFVHDVYSCILPCIIGKGAAIIIFS